MRLAEAQIKTLNIIFNLLKERDKPDASAVEKFILDKYTGDTGLVHGFSQQVDNSSIRCAHCDAKLGKRATWATLDNKPYCEECAGKIINELRNTLSDAAEPLEITEYKALSARVRTLYKNATNTNVGLKLTKGQQEVLKRAHSTLTIVDDMAELPSSVSCGLCGRKSSPSKLAVKFSGNDKETYLHLDCIEDECHLLEKLADKINKDAPIAHNKSASLAETDIILYNNHQKRAHELRDLMEVASKFEHPFFAHSCEVIYSQLLIHTGFTPIVSSISTNEMGSCDICGNSSAAKITYKGNSKKHFMCRACYHASLTKTHKELLNDVGTLLNNLEQSLSEMQLDNEPMSVSRYQLEWLKCKIAGLYKANLSEDQLERVSKLSLLSSMERKNKKSTCSECSKLSDSTYKVTKEGKVRVMCKDCIDKLYDHVSELAKEVKLKSLSANLVKLADEEIVNAELDFVRLHYPEITGYELGREPAEQLMSFNMVSFGNSKGWEDYNFWGPNRKNAKSVLEHIVRLRRSVMTPDELSRSYSMEKEALSKKKEAETSKWHKQIEEETEKQKKQHEEHLDKKREESFQKQVIKVDNWANQPAIDIEEMYGEEVDNNEPLLALNIKARKVNDYYSALIAAGKKADEVQNITVQDFVKYHLYNSTKAGKVIKPSSLVAQAVPAEIKFSDNRVKCSNCNTPIYKGEIYAEGVKGEWSLCADCFKKQIEGLRESKSARVSFTLKTDKRVEREVAECVDIFNSLVSGHISLVTKIRKTRSKAKKLGITSNKELTDTTEPVVTPASTVTEPVATPASTVTEPVVTEVISFEVSEEELLIEEVPLVEMESLSVTESPVVSSNTQHKNELDTDISNYTVGQLVLLFGKWFTNKDRRPEVFELMLKGLRTLEDNESIALSLSTKVKRYNDEHEDCLEVNENHWRNMSSHNQKLVRDIITTSPSNRRLMRHMRGRNEREKFIRLVGLIYYCTEMMVTEKEPLPGVEAVVNKLSKEDRRAFVRELIDNTKRIKPEKTNAWISEHIESRLKDGKKQLKYSLKELLKSSRKSERKITVQDTEKFFRSFEPQQFTVERTTNTVDAAVEFDNLTAIRNILNVLLAGKNSYLASEVNCVPITDLRKAQYIDILNDSYLSPFKESLVGAEDTNDLFYLTTPEKRTFWFCNSIGVREEDELPADKLATHASLMKCSCCGRVLPLNKNFLATSKQQWCEECITELTRDLLNAYSDFSDNKEIKPKLWSKLEDAKARLDGALGSIKYFVGTPTLRTRSGAKYNSFRGKISSAILMDSNHHYKCGECGTGMPTKEVIGFFDNLGEPKRFYCNKCLERISADFENEILTIKRKYSRLNLGVFDSVPMQEDAEGLAEEVRKTLELYSLCNSYKSNSRNGDTRGVFTLLSNMLTSELVSGYAVEKSDGVEEYSYCSCCGKAPALKMNSINHSYAGKPMYMCKDCMSKAQAKFSDLRLRLVIDETISYLTEGCDAEDYRVLHNSLLWYYKICRCVYEPEVFKMVSDDTLNILDNLSHVTEDSDKPLKFIWSTIFLLASLLTKNTFRSNMFSKLRSGADDIDFVELRHLINEPIDEMRTREKKTLVVESGIEAEVEAEVKPGTNTLAFLDNSDTKVNIVVNHDTNTTTLTVQSKNDVINETTTAKRADNATTKSKGRKRNTEALKKKREEEKRKKEEEARKSRADIANIGSVFNKYASVDEYNPLKKANEDIIKKQEETKRKQEEIKKLGSMFNTYASVDEYDPVKEAEEIRLKAAAEYKQLADEKKRNAKLSSTFRDIDTQRTGREFNNVTVKQWQRFIKLHDTLMNTGYVNNKVYMEYAGDVKVVYVGETGTEAICSKCREKALAKETRLKITGKFRTKYLCGKCVDKVSDEIEKVLKKHKISV